MKDWDVFIHRVYENINYLATDMNAFSTFNAVFALVSMKDTP